MAKPTFHPNTVVNIHKGIHTFVRLEKLAPAQGAQTYFNDAITEGWPITAKGKTSNHGSVTLHFFFGKVKKVITTNDANPKITALLVRLHPCGTFPPTPTPPVAGQSALSRPRGPLRDASGDTGTISISLGSEANGDDDTDYIPINYTDDDGADDSNG